MNRGELDLWLRCRNNIFEFVRLIWIVHPIQGRIQFDLYPFQYTVLREFLQNRFVVVLKARQMGLTELIAVYVLWRAIFFPYQNIQIISLKDRVAKKVLRRIKFMYINLPETLKTPIVNGRSGEIGTASEILFNNGSSIVSIPTTEDAGRSEAVSLLVMDEAAIMQYAETIWAAAFPTLSCVGYKTPIFLNSKEEIKKGVFKDKIEVAEIGTICPEEKGTRDISSLGLRTLSHKGRWQRILYSQNKGKLETWEVKDCKGETIKATPDHKFYTLEGWKSLREIIEGDLTVIQAETKVGGVYISKLQVIGKTWENIYDVHVEEDNSYISANNFINHNTGGSAIINSTPFGIGNFYYQTYSEALFNSNGFVPLKIRWDLHPDRDPEWYLSMRRALGKKRTAQEIDCDFLSSGDNVFDLTDIKAIEETIAENPPIEKRLNGKLLIFRRPVPGEHYFMGIDVSTGRASDYSAFSVMNKKGEEFAAFKGRVPINRLRDLVASTGHEYNKALLAPEANDIGEAIVSGLQLIGYNNLYYTRKLVKKRGQSTPDVVEVPGWYTTSKSRGIIINKLEEDIREDTVDILNPFFTNEAYTFIYDTMNRPVAMNKGEYMGDGSETYADDSILSEAITNFVRSGKQIPTEGTLPK